MKKILLVLSAVLLIGAAPLAGGTVYVPLTVDQTVDGARIETEVRVTNDSGLTRSFSYVFIPELTDGTTIDRATAKVMHEVAPHATMALNELAGTGQKGMLEIEAGSRLAITSRLVGTSAAGKRRTGAEMSVITGRNTIPPGETAIVQGLQRNANVKESDFYFFNLSPEPSLCVVEVFRRSGSRVLTAQVTLTPLSLRGFVDVLGLLGMSSVQDVSIATTCEGASHHFAKVRDLQTGEVLFIPPSGRSLSTFSCPDTALYEVEGDFHTPTPGNERLRFDDIFIAGGRTFSKLTIDMEFTHGGWSQPTNGNHAVIWLHRADRWRDNTFAYVNLFGPATNVARMTTNVDISPSVAAVQKGAVFHPGETYRLHYEYDTGRNRIAAVFTDSDDQEVVTLRGTPTVDRIVTQSPGFVAVFGHTANEAGPEVTTYGWIYSNLCIQLE